MSSFFSGGAAAGVGGNLAKLRAILDLARTLQSSFSIDDVLASVVDTALAITVLEDAGAPSGAVGSPVSSFVGGITDVDSGAVKGIAIVASNETNGTWYYTTNGGTSWAAVGTVSTAQSLLLADNANTRIYFSPNANYNGTVSGIT